MNMYTKWKQITEIAKRYREKSVTLLYLDIDEACLTVTYSNE